MSLHTVILWRPRADEHALAASLHLCEADPEVLRAIIDGAQEMLARDHPGARVRVYRWHVWRIVRAMAKCGLLNTPDGRASAYTYLAAEPDDAD